MPLDNELETARRVAHIENEIDLKKVQREQEILHANDAKLNQRMDKVEEYLNELSLYSGYPPLRKHSDPRPPHMHNGDSPHVQ